MLRFSLVCVFIAGICQLAIAQDYRWQQRVEYTMDARLDVNTHKITGTQKLVYFNNSKDTLTKVYYHLYWNAFQPGSMMDVRSRSLPDPDGRVTDRISKLTESEIGYQKVTSLKQDGKDVSMHVDGTILEVTLKKPILPNTKAVFDMKFESQVPVQIRRSGRNNREGISYSMTQWYPKLAEYDFQGWHINQYVAREFHGVWGDFEVKLTLDPKFVVAGTGKLQNPEKIGHGYEKEGTKVERPKGDLTWYFKAKDVIDFAWAADPEYKHDIVQVPDGPTIHLFYQPGEKTNEGWTKLRDESVKHFQFMNKFYGKYPYDTYSIIQGGDGGMEYPMCTLIIGERPGLAGLMAHEVAHSWYQAVLASNESLYAWFDEGFTDYASAESEANMFGKSIADCHKGSYGAYFGLVKSGLQEPMSTLSDHFNTNRAYGTSAYSMGAVYLHQMRYIIGEDNFYKGMQRYYNTWKMRHPEPIDFVRVMEKTSGMQLKWYANYWLYTTKRIDYGVKSAVEEGGATNVTLERIGQMPMPIDLLVTYKDGSKELFYIPLNETFGNKPVEDKTIGRTDLAEWYWTSPTYTFKINKSLANITLIEIDPRARMADIVKDNNKFDPAAQNLKPAEPTQPKKLALTLNANFYVFIMTADQAKKKINALIEEIEEHTELYYQEHRTEITDKQFDDLLKQLNNLEKEFPQFKSVNSPTQRVGGAITKDFPHVFHEYPMVSLGNAYSNQDLFDFDNRIFKNLGHRDFDYICEQKFDGASLSLVYKKNVLVSGVTRGDGFWGDDVTNNVKTIRNIPLRIKGENIPEEFHVRGEVFFSKSIFTKLNKELEDIGEEKYSNARNTASGTLRMQDSAEVSRRKLDCYVYNLLGENIGTQTHEGNLKKLKEWKFNVSPTYKKCIDIQEVIAYITYWEDERKNLEVETDGVVIKVNTLRHQRELGFTAKVPRWAIAYKYKSESALTVLNSITYQVGRTGAITPVAELEPVQLAGTIVKRASLHNANEIERLDLRIGDYVFVEKGGEIIPKVTGVDTTKRTQKTRRIIYLTYCPECKTPLVRTEGEASHYCPNINSCPPQIKGRVEHFIQRKAMDINSLGEQTIRQLFEKNLLRTPADLYDLTKKDLLTLDKVKDKSAQKLLDGIQQSKTVSFESVLFAIGIRYVGKTVAEKLARHFKTIDAIMAANYDQLLEAPEIGEKIAQSVIAFSKMKANQKEIERLKKAGLQFTVVEQEVIKESDNLAGKSFVISGTFEKYERDDLRDVIIKNGGKVASSISGKLDYVLAGDNMGPAKKEKADKLGVKIISEQDFEKLLKGKSL